MTHLAPLPRPCHLSRTLRYAFAVRPTPRQLEHAPSRGNRIGEGLHAAAAHGEPRRPICGPIRQWMAQTCADASLNAGLRAQMIHDMMLIATDTLQQVPEDIIRSACQHLHQLFLHPRHPAGHGDMLSRRLILQHLGNLVILAAQISSKRDYERSART